MASEQIDWWFAEWPQRGRQVMARGEGMPRADLQQLVVSAGGYFVLRTSAGQRVVVRARQAA